MYSEKVYEYMLGGVGGGGVFLHFLKETDDFYLLLKKIIKLFVFI